MQILSSNLIHKHTTYLVAGLSLYTELGSIFPDRSGAEVVYLEQAYPKPRSLVPVSFAVTTVLLSCGLIFI